MMKRPGTWIGVLFILVGIVALIHPRLAMPATKTEVHEAGRTQIIETRRIISVPWFLSALFIIAGTGFIIIGPPPKPASSKRTTRRT